MWTTAQSDELFDTYSAHPGQTTVIPSATPNGPRLLDADALVIAEAIRDRASQTLIPIVVRTRSVERHPGHAHVIVYHTPDASDSAIVH